MKLGKFIPFFFIFMGALAKEKIFQASVHAFLNIVTEKVCLEYIPNTQRTLGFLLLSNLVTNFLLKQKGLSNGCKAGNSFYWH